MFVHTINMERFAGLNFHGFQEYLKSFFHESLGVLYSGIV